MVFGRARAVKGLTGVPDTTFLRPAVAMGPRASATSLAFRTKVAPSRIRMLHPAARASKGWDWSFKAPVLAGDTLSAILRVDDIRPAHHEDQATLILTFEVTNQTDVLVQYGTNRLLAYR